MGQMDPILRTLYLSKSSRQFDPNLSFPKFISLVQKAFLKTLSKKIKINYLMRHSLFADYFYC